jgi:Reverse transcriptase (RNA-dependent DNA polymerase)
MLFPTPSGPKQFKVDVIDFELPLLIGLDAMRKLQITIDPTSMTARLPDCYIPLVCIGNHIGLDWTPPHEVAEFYTKAELRNLHKNLMHPSALKLHALLRKAQYEELPPETRNILEEISHECESCQRHTKGPVYFRIRDVDNVIFNQELYLDLFWIEKKPVLHIIDRGTRFSAAAFLPAQDAVTVWNTFVRCWVMLYIGWPDSMLTDQGSVFISRAFHSCCNTSGITLRHVGTEAHNSMNVGEKLHGPIRETFLKLKETHPELDDDTRLAHCIYAANAHSGPDGLCPLALVFGVQPKLPGETRYESHTDRIRASLRAREEYARLLAKRRIRTGIKAKPPEIQDIAAGQHVYVHRERDGWSGPHVCMGADGKRAIVDLGEATGPRSFNISRLKLAHMTPALPPDAPLHSLQAAVYVTEVIGNNDPRAAAFGPAIQKEMMNLIDRGTFRIAIQPDEINGRTSNILPSRFVLAIKRRDNGEEIFKARLVIGGHRDREKQSRVHTANTMRSTSLRMIMAIAAIFGFRLASVDVAQAYLLAAQPLLRDIYVKLPPGTIELNESELVQLLKPLYGLSESGDYWASTLSNVLLSKVNLTQAQSDMTIFFRKLANRLVLVHGSHVDDIIHAAPPEELDDTLQELREHFEMKEPEYDQFPFAGTDVDGTEFSLCQSGYIARLKHVPIPCPWDTYQSRRASVAYVKSTRPDIAADVSIHSAVTRQIYTDSDAEKLNLLITRLHDTKEVTLHYPKLEWNSFTCSSTLTVPLPAVESNPKSATQ